MELEVDLHQNTFEMAQAVFEQIYARPPTSADYGWLFGYCMALNQMRDRATGRDPLAGQTLDYKRRFN